MVRCSMVALVDTGSVSCAVRMIETHHKWAKPSITNIDSLN